MIERKQTKRQIERRVVFYKAINSAVQILTQSINWQNEIPLVLALVGQAMDVSQVSLYENKKSEGGKLWMTQRFVWPEPGKPNQFDSPALAHIAYDQFASLQMEERLSQNQVVYGSVDSVPPEMQTAWVALAVRSFMLTPIFSGECWWGLISFIDCRAIRDWNEVELDALKMAMDILGSVIHRQEIEENLRASEEHLRQVTINMLDMVSQCDSRGVLNYLSPSCKAILGYEPEELMGKFAFDLVHPEDLSIFKSIIQRSVNEHLIRKIEYRRRHADGHYIWLETVSKFMFDEQGKSLGVIFGSRDITDRKRIEVSELEQRSLAEALRDTASVLTSTLDFEEVLDRILLNIGRVIPHDTVDIYLVEEGIAHSVRSQGYANRNEEMAVQSLRFVIADVPNFSRMMETGQSLAIPDVNEYLGWVDISEVPWVRSCAGAPIRIQSETVGFLTVVSATPGFYTSIMAERIQVFAEQAAIAIQNARLFEETQQRAAQLSVLNETTEALRDTAAVLTSTLDFDEVLARILTNVGRVVAHDAANITLVENEYARVVRAVRYDIRQAENEVLPLRFRISEVPNLRWMIDTGKPLAIPDVWLYPKWLNLPQTAWIRSYAGAPIRIKGETLGFLSLDSARPGFFNYDHAERLQAFANQAAIAIQNARLYEETQQRARQLTLLNELTRTALEMADLHLVLQTIADRMGELMHADGCYLTLWDQKRQAAIPAAAYGIHHDVYPTLGIEAGEATLTAVVLNSGKSLVIEDVPHSPLISRRISGFLQMQSILTIPLIASDQKLGAMLIAYNHNYAFKQEEINYCEQAARQVTLAIARVQLFEAERQRSAQLSRTNFFITALSNVAAKIKTVPDPDEVMATLGLELKQLGVYCMVALFEKNSSSLVIRYLSFKDEITGFSNRWAKVLSDFRLPLQDFSFYDELIVRRHVIFTDDPRPIVRAVTTKIPSFIIDQLADMSSLTAESKALALPLMVEEKVIGFMGMWGNDLQEADLSAASMFGSQVAITLENARLYGEIQQIAITDDLTGFYNRRGLFELGQREIERAFRFKRPLAALMVDLDFFKVVNDTYSHAVGDQVLQGLAARCRENVREVDLLGRYGGEEFVILLVENDLAVAIQVAERLRLSIGSSPFPTTQGDITITVSVGVAILSPKTPDLATLIDLADQSLYTAKILGRNRVSAASDVV